MFKFPKHPEQQRKQSGFTLIELAIIMAIVAILGAVGAVKLASMRDDAAKAAEASALANVRSALAIAFAKDTNNVVTVAELGTYLEGGTAGLTGTVAASKADNSLTWTPKTGGTSYTVVVSSDANSSIENIVSVATVK